MQSNRSFKNPAITKSNEKVVANSPVQVSVKKVLMKLRKMRGR
jgi:hypothetical protein